MSSRDDANRPRLRDVSQPDGTDRPGPRSRFSDVDPADIDRYLSGRPSKSQDQSAKPKPRLSTTAGQLEQLQQQVSAGGTRSRRPVSTPPPAAAEDGETTPRPSAASLAARSSFRTNRRASYMREDPYVDDIDDIEEREADDVPAPPRDTRRPSAPEYETERWETADIDWDRAQSEHDDDPAPRPRRERQRRPRPSIQRPAISRPAMPRAISNADVANDLPALVFIAISTLGLAAMAILVANRMATLDPVLPTHVSASGVFERFASRETIWQIPLLATMLTLMNIVASWFVSPLDRFASRFLLVTAVVVQFVAWVAILRILY